MNCKKVQTDCSDEAACLIFGTPPQKWSLIQQHKRVYGAPSVEWIYESPRWCLHWLTEDFWKPVGTFFFSQSFLIFWKEHNEYKALTTRWQISCRDLFQGQAAKAWVDGQTFTALYRGSMYICNNIKVVWNCRDRYVTLLLFSGSTESDWQRGVIYILITHLQSSALCAVSVATCKTHPPPPILTSDGWLVLWKAHV